MLPYRVIYLAFLGLLTQGNLTSALPQGDYQRHGEHLNGRETFQNIAMGEQTPDSVSLEHGDGSDRTSRAVGSRALLTGVDDKADWQVTKNIYAFNSFLVQTCMATTICYFLLKKGVPAASAIAWQHLSEGAKWTVAKGVVAVENAKRKASKLSPLDEEAQLKEEKRVIQHGNELASEAQGDIHDIAQAMGGAAGLPVPEGESDSSGSKKKGHSVDVGTQTESSMDKKKGGKKQE